MNKAENQETGRVVRREFSRHTVDTSDVQISTNHGVVTLHGRVRPMRGHESGFEENVTAMLKVLRQRAGIRDVIVEWKAIF